MPTAIASWPALPSDLLAASIQHLARAGDLSKELSDINEANVNSILAASDSNGRLHCFLDGSYPLGAVQVNSGSTTTSLYRDPNVPVLFAHLHTPSGPSTRTTLLPVSVDLSLLRTRIPRDVARASTTARELLWYTMRVVDEMRVAWLGSESQPGGREPGNKWLQTLEGLQQTAVMTPEGLQPKTAGGKSVLDPGWFINLTILAEDKTTWSLVDLTIFLVSGRSTDAISDFIGSGEQMSERVRAFIDPALPARQLNESFSQGLQKWESTVGEALVKLRDYSGQRVVPACQRLHLVLEEVLGWSEL